MSVEAVQVKVTLRVEPEHDTVRLKLPGVVGTVVSRMIDCGVRDHGVPLEPLRARPETVLLPLPDVRFHAVVGVALL